MFKKKKQTGRHYYKQIFIKTLNEMKMNTKHFKRLFGTLRQIKQFYLKGDFEYHCSIFLFEDKNVSTRKFVSYSSCVIAIQCSA